MDSTDSDHSISQSISIPQWMRSRNHEGFDTEISTLSPPNQDDSFFYIPYSKITKSAVTSSSGPSLSAAAGQVALGNVSEAGASSSNSLISKHTQPCLKFLGEGKNMDITDLTGFNKDEIKKGPKPIKSFGTDDGFKSEAAQCGHSVVQVAQQMIADRFIGRPTKLPTDQNGEDQFGAHEIPYLKQRVRRGSKSLPASPLSTPDSTPQIQRKNRYFTGAFVESSEEPSKFAGGWLVAGLLGVHRENLSESQSDLADSNNNASLQTKQSFEKSGSEKETQASPLHESRSVASLVKVAKSGTDNTVKKPRPKPSELREMNFWSPTSM
ncbi:Cytochrome P450 monooxygenase alnH [Frankliniella fusca]|uniref:Cytochrome P450 monooxygenase alnH n=1 Tax=Frankliniella fusca TaxID=407009 RepID=A0AAE1HJQ9_9NEOP|nr:Cytochrome P450 monooxygenase alnH [Frankliniella fusca]